MIDFLNSYNIADHLIVAKPGWYKKFCEIKTLRKKLRSFAPNLCLDLHGDLPSGFASKLSGSGKHLSVNGKKRRLFGRSKITEYSEQPLEKCLKLLETLGVAGASIDYHLPEIPLERREAGWVLGNLGLESTPFAMLGVGVQSCSNYSATIATSITGRSSGWDIDRYVQVAEHLWYTHNLPTVVTWQGAQEKLIAEKIEDESGGMVALVPVNATSATTSATPLSAIPFAVLARRTSVFVGTDNDFLHLAAAVGAPCIGVFCDENTRRNAPRCSNLHAIMAQAGGQRWKRRGVKTGAPPVRIDNYTYDVIQVCNACDDILQPEIAPAITVVVRAAQQQNQLVEI